MSNTENVPQTLDLFFADDPEMHGLQQPHHWEQPKQNPFFPIFLAFLVNNRQTSCNFGGNGAMDFEKQEPAVIEILKPFQCQANRVIPIWKRTADEKASKK